MSMPFCAIGRIALLAAALAVMPSFAAPRPVAHWDVVPYQRVSAPFKAGVVAFYDKDFKVEFTVNGKKVATVEAASYNDRTRVNEHWFTLDVAGMKDGPVTLGANVIAADGSSFRLDDLPLYADAGGTLGSKKVIWVDPVDGIDYSEGTQDRPVKTLKRAIFRAKDGGTIYLMRPGAYDANRIGGGSDRRYWTTITPAPGLTRKDVRVKGGRTGCDKLRFKGVQLFCNVVGGQGYLLAGVDENSVCWVEDCIMSNAAGRESALSYPFGNRLVGYVTGGATTEMGKGPCARLVRNHVIKNISAEAFSGSDCLAVNCRVNGIDSLGVVDTPAFSRFQAIGGAWSGNVIFANIKADDCNSNGFTGAKLRDSVFSNVTLAMTGGEKFESRFSGDMENVWFDKVALSGQEWVWTDTDSRVGDFKPVDVRVTGCSFELPKEAKEDDL